MNRALEKLIENFGLWFDNLTERERRLIFLLTISLSSIILVSAIYFAVTKIDNKKNLLSKNKNYVLQIKELEGEYFKAKKENEKAQNRIKKNSVSLFSLISSITSKLSLSIKDLNETKRPIGKTEVVEVSVKLSLSKLSIDRLIALIEAIEKSEDGGDLVKVTRLKVNKRFDEPDMLDIQMTVSTWKSA